MIVPLARVQHDQLGIIKWSIIGIVSLFGWGVWILRSLYQKKIVFRMTPIDLPVLGIFILYLISPFLSEYSLFPYKRAFQLCPTLLLFFLIVQVVRGSKERFEVLGAFLISLSIVAVIGVEQYHGLIPTDWQGVPWEKGLGKRVFSTLWNPNFLATLLISMIPILILLFLNVSKRLVFFTGLLILLFISCLLYTNSWGGWVSLGAAMICLALFAVVGREQKLIRIKLYRNTCKNLILLLVFVLWITASFIHDKQSQIAEEKTGLIVRLMDWNTGLRMIKDHPIIGYGGGNFVVFGNLYQRELLHDDKFNSRFEKYPSLIMRQPGRVHQEYMNIIIEIGVLGFIFLIWAIVGFFRTVIIEQKKVYDPIDRAILIGLLFGLTAFLCQSFITPTTHTSTGMLCLVLMLGVGMSFGRRKEIKLSINKSRSIFILFGFAWACGLALFIYYSFLPIHAQLHFFNGMEFERKGKYNQALHQYKRSIYFDLFEPAIFYRMGETYLSSGDYLQATDIFKESFHYYPYYAYGHLGLARALIKLEKNDEAISELSKAVNFEPREPQAYYLIGELMMENGDLQKARDYLLQGHSFIPEDHLIMNMSAIISYKMGTTQEAVKLVDKAMNFSDNRAYLEYNRRIMIKKEQKDRLIDYKGYIWVNSMMDRGIKSLQWNRIDNAMKEFQAITSRYPTYVPALSNIGIVLMRKEKFEEAAKQWETVLQIDPHHEPTLQNLGNLQISLR